MPQGRTEKKKKNYNYLSIYIKKTGEVGRTTPSGSHAGLWDSLLVRDGRGSRGDHEGGVIPTACESVCEQETGACIIVNFPQGLLCTVRIRTRQSGLTLQVTFPRLSVRPVREKE